MDKLGELTVNQPKPLRFDEHIRQSVSDVIMPCAYLACRKCGSSLWQTGRDTFEHPFNNGLPSCENQGKRFYVPGIPLYSEEI